MFRKFFIRLSESPTARKFVTHFGPANRMARRFVAGETMDEAIAAVRALNRRGIKGLLNEVGESVTTPGEAHAAAQIFHQLLHRIHAEGLDSTVSLKPSHVGMSFGPDFCYQNIAGIVEVAQKLGNMVEMDIEASPDVPATVDIYHRLLDTFGGGVRLALQSYLFRSLADAQAIANRGGSVRLVKGAYAERPEIAHQSKSAINQASIEMMNVFLALEAQENGAYLALGSHDPILIDWLTRETGLLGIGRDKFEFQMLLGIRRDEQQRLADLGYRMRVYVPFGSAWYPYFMRRLAERPANVWFFANSLWRA
jgi:proline dehydrogenase